MIRYKTYIKCNDACYASVFTDVTEDGEPITKYELGKAYKAVITEGRENYSGFYSCKTIQDTIDYFDDVVLRDGCDDGECDDIVQVLDNMYDCAIVEVEVNDLIRTEDCGIEVWNSQTIIREVVDPATFKQLIIERWHH